MRPATHSGVCHSDLAFISNRYQHMPELTRKGQIGGHKGIGSSVKLGEGVTNVKLGYRVGVKWITSTCLSCDLCMAEFAGRCASRKVPSYRDPGTFQQYMISDPKHVTPIPHELDSAEAAPLLCGSFSVYSALLKSDCKPGDWIGLSGAIGGLGHLAIKYAEAFGPLVLGIDHGTKKVSDWSLVQLLSSISLSMVTRVLSLGSSISQVEAVTL